MKKEEKRGRKSLPVIDSVPFSQIIFLISSGINYPQAISKSRKTDPSATIKQITTLKKQGFLFSKKEKLLNKTIYSLNKEKISETFIQYMNDKKQNNGFNLSNKYSQNKYLGEYLKEIFASYKEIKVTKIREIFETFSISTLESLALFTSTDKDKELADFSTFLDCINPAAWENHLFIEKSEKILNNFIKD